MTRIFLLMLAFLCLGADIAFGADGPPSLETVLEAEPPDRAAKDDGGLSGEMRSSAIRAAALAFGSRAGLARRGWEIAAMLERHAQKLSAVYRFRSLTMRKDGFTVIPPVLAQTDRAFRLERSGRQAAGAARILRIVEPERIVSAVPHWRDYLEREWPEADLPAAVLFPRSEAEAARWRRWLREGWKHGTALADDIFAADLDRLNRVFEGLVRWRRANLAGMVLLMLRSLREWNSLSLFAPLARSPLLSASCRARITAGPRRGPGGGRSARAWREAQARRA